MNWIEYERGKFELLFANCELSLKERYYYKMNLKVKHTIVKHIPLGFINKIHIIINPNWQNQNEVIGCWRVDIVSLRFGPVSKSSMNDVWKCLIHSRTSVRCFVGPTLASLTAKPMLSSVLLFGYWVILRQHYLSGISGLVGWSGSSQTVFVGDSSHARNPAD